MTMVESRAVVAWGIDGDAVLLDADAFTHARFVDFGSDLWVAPVKPAGVYRWVGTACCTDDTINMVGEWALLFAGKKDPTTIA